MLYDSELLVQATERQLTFIVSTFRLEEAEEEVENLKQEINDKTRVFK